MRYLAGEADIRQFLDVGTGLPTVDNTHEVVQWVAPESPHRIRGQGPAGAGARPGLLTRRPEGTCDYIGYSGGELTVSYENQA